MPDSRQLLQLRDISNTPAPSPISFNRQPIFKFMITKYWRISLSKNGNPVTLYTTTTDTMVDTDLGGDASRSLIHVARQFHRHPQTDEQNHRDLAIGAIMAHATEPPYDRSNARIVVADSVPNAQPVAYVGGSRTAQLVPIWEESDDFE